VAGCTRSQSPEAEEYNQTWNVAEDAECRRDRQDAGGKAQLEEYDGSRDPRNSSGLPRQDDETRQLK
jgi:hypothetical protein